MDRKQAIDSATEALSGIDKLKEVSDKAVLRAAQEALSGVEKLREEPLRSYYK